jgi:2-oxoglutarate dehydrogenase E2 component (dihydrolipoamide succinyltransferase)
MNLEVKIPNVAESITEVTLSKWLVKSGDYVKMDQAICEIETEKAGQELYAEKPGSITLIANEGDDIKVGALIANIDTDAKAPVDATPVAEKSLDVKAPVQEVAAASQTLKTEKSYATGTAGPATTKLMTENNIDVSKVNGSGPKGRITKGDVLQAIANGTAANGYIAAQATSAASFSREQRTEKMSRLRKTISERLVFAKNSTAMLTTFNEVDCSAMMALRAKYGDKFKEKHGIGLGFMSFFTKACALALMKFPAVNGCIEDEALVYHDYADISIAVSTPKGLVVPVIRNAESLTMAGIEKAVKELAIKGRDGKLSMDDMTGGTFTITNGGVFGSLMSTPIINPPQSAILGMHKFEDRAVVINGKIEIRSMMYVALSYDHRIIDGKESVSFLVYVKDLLENPHKLLLGEDPVELLLQL